MVEVLVGAGIILLALVGLIGVYTFYLQTTLSLQERIQAGALLEEGIEAVKFMRDNGWSSITALSASSTYYIVFTGTTWQASSATSSIDGTFYRSFVINQVYRDVNSQIASSGTIDPNSRKLTVSVSWREGKATTTKSLSTYITNIFGT